MTILARFCETDAAGGTRAYLVADSRLSDPKLPRLAKLRWDHATKLFRLRPTGAILGYCGESMPALQAIAQAMELLALTDVLRTWGDATCPQPKARLDALLRHLDEAFGSFPAAWGPEATLCYLDYDFRLSKFVTADITIGAGGAISAEELQDLAEGRIMWDGSGAPRARVVHESNHAGAASFRAVVATVESLMDNDREPAVGGWPQAIRITRAGSVPIGFLRPVGQVERRVLLGLPLSLSSKLEQCEFYDAAWRRV
jgi:hypothetical protein